MSAISTLNPDRELTPINKMRGIGFVGTGAIFADHAVAALQFPERLRAVAAADVDESKLRQASERFFVPLTYTDHRKLLDRADVDIVVVCTPPAFHEGVVVDALEAGKFVICEKPIAHNLESADRIIDAARRFPNKLTVVYQWRFADAVRKAVWARNEGLLGQPLFGRFTRYGWHDAANRPDSWWGRWNVAGGGVVMTQCIHELDLIVHLFGRPTEVTAAIATHKQPIESEDAFAATIRFENKAIVTCSSTINCAENGSTFEVIGSQATVWDHGRVASRDPIHNQKIQESLARAFPTGRTPGQPSNSLAARAWRKALRKLHLGGRLSRTPGANMHTPYYKACLDALDSGSPPPVTPEEARLSVDLCEGIYASALAGETVKLPLDSSHRYYQGITVSDYEKYKLAR